MDLREATERDWDRIWPLWHRIVAGGDTYAYAPETDFEEARDLWLRRPRRTLVAEEAGVILGTYYLRTNQSGPGQHVCNCGYMVDDAARGRGLATAMCEHSQVLARDLGYLAMQFNFVASSNEGAVRLWKKLGFEVVGTLPRGFRHPQQGLIDALIMYKWLGT